MFSPQQVLDYIKIRGGSVTLRELGKFGSSLIARLESRKCIEVTGKAGDCQVHLICDDFEHKQQEKEKIEQDIITLKKDLKTVKEPAKSTTKSPKIKQVKPREPNTESQKFKCKQIRASILEEIRKAAKPITVKELKKNLCLSMSSRCIFHHLNTLKKQNTVCSFHLHTTWWASVENKEILNSIAPTYIGREGNKNVVLAFLEKTERALSLEEITKSLPIKLSTNTVRKILDIFIENNVVAYVHPFLNGKKYFALTSNEKALKHLNRLNKPLNHFNRKT